MTGPVFKTGGDGAFRTAREVRFLCASASRGLFYSVCGEVGAALQGIGQGIRGGGRGSLSGDRGLRNVGGRGDGDPELDQLAAEALPVLPGVTVVRGLRWGMGDPAEHRSVAAVFLGQRDERVPRAVEVQRGQAERLTVGVERAGHGTAVARSALASPPCRRDDVVARLRRAAHARFPPPCLPIDEDLGERGMDGDLLDRAGLRVPLDFRDGLHRDSDRDAGERLDRPVPVPEAKGAKFARPHAGQKEQRVQDATVGRDPRVRDQPL